MSFQCRPITSPLHNIKRSHPIIIRIKLNNQQTQQKDFSLAIETARDLDIFQFDAVIQWKMLSHIRIQMLKIWHHLNLYEHPNENKKIHKKRAERVRERLLDNIKIVRCFLSSAGKNHSNDESLLILIINFNCLCCTKLNDDDGQQTIFLT